MDEAREDHDDEESLNDATEVQGDDEFQAALGSDCWRTAVMILRSPPNEATLP